MKIFLSSLVAASLTLFASSSLAAQNQQFGAGGLLDVDGLAQRTFNTCDQNRDGELNRGEFATAERIVHSAVNRLGQSGMIGRGQPLNLNGLPNGGRALAGGFLNNNDHITQPEFTLYVRNAVQQADAALRRNSASRSYPSNYRRGYGRRGSYGRGYSNYGRPRSPLATLPVSPLALKNPAQPATVGPLAAKGQTAASGQTATTQKPNATARQHHATHNQPTHNKSTAPSGKSKSSGQQHAPHPPAHHQASISHAGTGGGHAGRGHSGGGHHKR